MVNGNSEILTVLTMCCLCTALTGTLTILTLAFLRGRGSALLPFLQVLLGRSEAADDALLDKTMARTVSKPDLRAIAREHDFDAALARQQQASPAPGTAPIDWEAPSDPSAAAPAPGDTQRIRDEDDEFGFDTLDH